MDFWTGLLTSILQTAISPTTAAFVIAAIGLNIHFGFTGLMNMGQAGFMLVGAYGFGVSVVMGAGFWVAILIANRRAGLSRRSNLCRARRKRATTQVVTD